MALEKLGEPTRFTRRPEQTSRPALTAQGDLEGMEHAKQANGSGHELSIGHSPSSARKKAVRKKAESPRPLRKEAGSKSKSGKLGCRYCGSDDLAPSFIRRRDRRCRKCFSKRLDLWHQRRRRRSRSSLAAMWDEGPGSKRARPLFVLSYVLRSEG